MEKMLKIQKDTKDSKNERKFYKYNVGDLIYVLRGKKKKKLDSNWIGPYEIVEVVNELVYNYKKGKNVESIHVSRNKTSNGSQR